MMMNWKEFGRNRSWPNFKVLFRHSPGETDVKHEKSQINIAGRRGREWNPGLPEYEVGVLTLDHDVQCDKSSNRCNSGYAYHVLTIDHTCRNVNYKYFLLLLGGYKGPWPPHTEEVS
jgi:hypothetical protein